MSEIKRAIALGFFDGVHVGHAALLNRTKERAARIGAMPSVLSFDVHPDNLVFGREVPLINSAIGREDIIRRCFGIDNVVFIHFNRHVMCMPWQEFIESIITELNVAWVVVGHDFSFGYKGMGNAQRLSEYCAARGIGCDIIPAVTIDGRIVSSTYIRELICTGNIKEANRYLGHPHMLADTVHSVTNVGVRPTVSEDNRVSVESHLLDYKGNLYGRQARVEFYDFIRGEQKFDSFETLSAQIRRDAETARRFFEEEKG